MLLCLKLMLHQLKMMEFHLKLMLHQLKITEHLLKTMLHPLKLIEFHLKMTLHLPKMMKLKPWLESLQTEKLLKLPGKFIGWSLIFLVNSFFGVSTDFTNFVEHSLTVAENIDFRAFVVIPADGNFF